MARKRSPQLTERQREIAYMLAGRTQEGIANELGLSVRNVRYHVEAMRRMFHVHSTVELIAVLREQNLIE